MAKYDVINQFIDNAGKYRLIVEAASVELINLNPESAPSIEEIKAEIDKLDKDEPIIEE